MAMAAGLATGETIEREGLLAHVRALADATRTRLTGLQQELPIIQEIRVCGMMIGIELSIPATPAVQKCMDRGVLINATQNTVVRLLPALNIPAQELSRGLDVVSEVLREMVSEKSEPLTKPA